MENGKIYYVNVNSLVLKKIKNAVHQPLSHISGAQSLRTANGHSTAQLRCKTHARPCGQAWAVLRWSELALRLSGAGGDSMCALLGCRLPQDPGAPLLPVCVSNFLVAVTPSVSGTHSLRRRGLLRLTVCGHSSPRELAPRWDGMVEGLAERAAPRKQRTEEGGGAGPSRSQLH